MIQRRSLRLMAVFAGVLGMACAQSQPPLPTVLSGQLVNGSKAGVAEALVEWSVPGGIIGPGNSTFTDSNGNFAFEMPLSAATEVTLSITANLYNPAQTNVQLQPGTPSHVSIKLVRKPSGQYAAVSGTVRNTIGVVIPNATVSILGAGALLTTTTNSSGFYKLSPVGFNSSLTLQVATANAPCIVTTQLPLDVNATQVKTPVTAAPVLSPDVNCPPSPPLAGGAALFQAMDRPRPAISIDDTVQWQQADAFSIESPGAPNAMNAGRVNDILRFPPGQGILVASDQGGVWSIAEDSNRTATPLSNQWSAVAISSLAQGTGGPQDIYAGTFVHGDSSGGILWETDTSQSQPLNNWLPLGVPCLSINKILVISEFNLIVLACDTGLWWSQIPPAPSVRGTYNWQQAVPSAYGSKAFSGLAKGPGWSVTGTIGTIVASRWLAGSAALIFNAKWTGSKLTLTPTSVAASGTFSRTSVAACSSNPNIMYAVASKGNGQDLADVFESTNAGLNWSPTSSLPSEGGQGDSNQAVAVSPDCSAVAVGWQVGTHVSFDSGASWKLLTDTGEYNNLHTDIHSLLFDPTLPATLWIGSSGGVASAMGVLSGGTPAFESDWNWELFNLEFFQGAPSASVAGLFGGASQDNGVIYSVLQGVWQHVMDCPSSPECWGNVALFATPAGIGPGNDVLVAENALSPSSNWGAQSVESVNGTIPFNGGAPIPITGGCSPCTPYALILAAPVRYPGRVVNSSGQKMIAAGVINFNPLSPESEAVYGLFGNDDGSSIHWEPFSFGGTLWTDVTAIAPTYDGGSIFLGTGDGRILRLDSGTSSTPFSGPAINLTVNVPASCAPSCPVTGLYAFNFIQNDPNTTITPPGLAYAAYGPHFMAYFGTSWDELGQTDLPHVQNFLSILAADPTRIYLASSAGVFDTSNGGGSWSSASVGLPAFIAGEPGFQLPTPGNLASHDYLQLAFDSQLLSTRLYLASYGRSVWRTYRPLPSPPPQRAFQNVTILIETGNDNLEDYSELQGVLHTSPPQSICLKPSDTTDPSPGGVCNNGPTSTDKDGNTVWANGMSVSQTFNLGVPVVLDGATFEMDLIQHNSGLQTPDNWDIQEVEVFGTDGSGSLLVLGISNGAISGNNCMARLKASPNPSSVVYGLSGNDPSGYNIAHPVPYFGPSPTGACPQ